MYAVTLKPKNSWPNGRLRAAGTLAPDSSVSLETILRLLEIILVRMPAVSTVLKTSSLRSYDFTAV